LPIKWFVKYPVCAISIILIVGNILKIAKNKKRIKMKQEEIEKKNLKILNEIDILKRQIEEKEQEIEKIQQEISNEQNLFLVNQTNLENILQKDLNKLFLEIESLEREISSLKVQINILEIEDQIKSLPSAHEQTWKELNNVFQSLLIEEISPSP